MEVERKGINELRVIDLRRELEKRGLDKSGVKAVLMDRLSKALVEEGLTPDTHMFEIFDRKSITKCEDTDKSVNLEEENAVKDLIEIKKELIKIEPEDEVKIDEKIENQEQAPPVTSTTDQPDSEQLEQEDETLITINEAEEGSLLGNDDEDGLQDESCSESTGDQNVKKAQQGQKRKKSKTYTSGELNLLVSIWLKYKSVIESKKTDSETWQLKRDAWEKIADEFNATNSVVFRSAKSIKHLYENLKKQYRKKIALNRQSLCKTGSENYVLTSFDKKFGQILAFEEVGLQEDPDFIETDSNNMAEKSATKDDFYFDIGEIFGKFMVLLLERLITIFKMMLNAPIMIFNRKTLRQQKTTDTDNQQESITEVLETVDTLDRTEEGEHANQDNTTANETLDDPGAANNTNNSNGNDHQQQSSTATDKNKDVKIGANLWVSNLSPETKATDLKRLFSRHGKLLGAKIVTSARTPGARCYGYVTMANTDDADRCIRFLHRVELHNRLVYVEKAKDDATGPLRNRTRSNERENANKRKDSVRRPSAPRPRRRTPPAGDMNKIKQERERQRREAERRDREAKARREYEEEMNARDRERRQRLMAERIEAEKIRLRIEREKIEREKEQLLKLERERQRLERERLEREKEEIRNRKKRLQERPTAPTSSRTTTKRPPVDDKRSEYPSKRQVIEKEDMLLEPPPPPRFNDSERQRDRSRRDDKRPPPRREDYRQSSPSRDRDRYSRDKIERRSGKDDSRTSSRYESKPKSHTDSKNWSSNGTQYGGYNREVWSTSRENWTASDSSTRWPADSQTVSRSSSYANAAYSGAAYSGHAQPSPPGASVAAAHGRYSDPRFDTYAHSLPVRKY